MYYSYYSYGEKGLVDLDYVFSGFTNVILLIAVVITIIAYWRIFTKAGEKGWKALIPIYNCYTIYKLVWNVKMFIVMLATVVLTYAFIFGLLLYSEAYYLNSPGEISITYILMVLTLISVIGLLILNIMFFYKLSKAYGYGAGFTVGLILVPAVFILILAFGSSEYQLGQERASAETVGYTYKNEMNDESNQGKEN